MLSAALILGSAAQRETITARTGTKRRAHDRHEFSSRPRESTVAYSITATPTLASRKRLVAVPTLPTVSSTASFNHRRDPRDPRALGGPGESATFAADRCDERTSSTPCRPIDLCVRFTFHGPAVRRVRPNRAVRRRALPSRPDRFAPLRRALRFLLPVFFLMGQTLDFEAIDHQLGGFKVGARKQIYALDAGCTGNGAAS